MQALILADSKKMGLSELVNNNASCMVQINGISIIEKMLRQLDEIDDITKIILVVGYQKKVLIEFVYGFCLKTDIVIIENNLYGSAEKLNSVFLAKDYLLMDDTVVLNSQLVLGEGLLESVLKSEEECVVVVDSYKSWMTGRSVSIDENAFIISIEQENSFNEKTLLDIYQMVGICKFNREFIKKYYVPSLEAIISVLGDNLEYSAPLNVIAMSKNVHIKALSVNEILWREINNVEDVSQTEISLLKDKELIAEKMLGSWGGYWRYPDYLDYFYLVTPYYPPQGLVKEIQKNFNTLIEQYPSGMRVNAKLAASVFGVSSNNIIIGNGAAELIKSMMEHIKGRTGFVRPTFDEYPNRSMEIETVNYVVDSDDFAYDADTLMNYIESLEICNLVLVNTDNPSGNYIPKADILRMTQWAKEKNIKVIVDESFVDFTDEPNPSLIDQDILKHFPNLYVIKSISKSYGVPGLRLGVLASGDENLIAWMKKDVSIWNINSFAEFYMQICGKYCEDYDKSLERFRKERSRFKSMLQKLNNIRVIPSQANYFMVELLNGLDAEELKQRMLIEKNVFIKTLNNKIKGKRQYLRIAIRNETDNNLFIQKLTETINEMIDYEKGKEENV